MGKAFGELFSQELKNNTASFYDFYLNKLTDILIKKKVPMFLAKDLTAGVRQFAYGLLDLNVMITRKYTNRRYI